MLLRFPFAPFVSPVVLVLMLTETPRLAFARTLDGKPPAAPANAERQTAPLVHLASADAQTLAGALRSVSNQAGLAFVAEGTPFRARGSAPPLIALAEKWLAKGLPLNEAVQKIAGAYDYDVERKGDVFLLRKRYTNPNDLPEVTTEELRLALRDASRAASALPAPTVPPVDNNEPNTPFMASFFKTLPSDAQAYFTNPTPKMQAITSGLVQMASENFISLKISHLNAPQQNALWQCTVARYIQFATGNALHAYQALQTVERNGTTFTPFVPKETADTTGEKNKKAVVYAAKRKENAIFPYFAPEGKVDAAPPVAADFAANGSVLPFADESEGAETQTLGDLRRLNKNPTVFTVDAGLEQKRVLVVQPLNTDADAALIEALFRAAGTVYGLRVFHKQEGAWRIARDRAQAPKELGALNTAVLSAFPEPLLRSFNHQFVDAEAKELAESKKERESDPGYDPKKSPWLEKMDKMSARRRGRFNAQRGLREAALRRFRILVEPSLAPDKSVPYSDFSDEARRLFTLAIVTECLDDLAKLSDESTPPTRAALEKSSLSGFISGAEKPSDRKFVFTVSLPPKEDDSTKVQMLTIGNVTFPAPPAKAE